MIDVSFEFFPPTSADGRRSLVDVAGVLAELGPRFMSVTYGAGGTSRDRTVETVTDFVASVGAPVAGHLTTVGATKVETQSVIDTYRSLGVEHIVALRGDSPADQSPDAQPPGYRSAVELVRAIRARPDGAGIEISVAAYPETHPRAASPQADIDNLARKLDAGANRAITQFFFDPELFLRFRDRAVAAGIDAQIVPGIMPIANFAAIARFAKRCGTSIPASLVRAFDGLEDDPEEHERVASAIAAEQCLRLQAEGIAAFHFYTMNRPQLSAATVQALSTASLLGVGSDPS